MLKVDIFKDYGSFKLDVNFESNDSVLGILGASGSGKSLTLKAIAGIIKPDRGRIVLDGKILYDSSKNINLRPQDRNVGFLFQDYALFPNMTVYENIKVGIRDKNLNTNELINKKLDEMKLQKVRYNYPSEISGGEKQRVALSRILVNGAKILLLDEPYSALDSYLRWKIELEIKNTIEKYKIPALFVSHDRDEIYRMCDGIIIMKNGKGEDRKSTRELFDKPLTLAAAELSGCKNFSEINHIRDDLFYAKDWGLTLVLKNYKPSDILGIRSHYVNLSENKEGVNFYELEVIKEVEELFGYTIIGKSKDSNNQGRLRIEVEKDKWNKLKEKERIFFQIDENKLLYLKK